MRYCLPKVNIYSSKSPEEVAVVGLVDCAELAISGDNIHGKYLVNTKPEQGRKRAVAAAECPSGDTHMWIAAANDRDILLRYIGVYLAPSHASRDSC